MNYKRLEIYVGWTCNQRCTYCVEYPNMEESWNKKVTKYEILKKLIKYKNNGYNHVTFLGGEPFIQPVFLDALKIGKKLGYTILVTTNATTLHLDNQASKFLPYIDELILSVEAIDKELQKKISRTNVFVNWMQVFQNIKKHWNGSFLKANIVITKDNISKLLNIVTYINKNGMDNISITYPDLMIDYYSKKYILEKIAPTYSECINEIKLIADLCTQKNILLKIVDFPFCVFPKENLKHYIKSSDDFDYGIRIKIDHNEKILDRGKVKEKNDIPRERFWVDKCNGCIFKGLCWGPSIYYKKLYGLREINPIK